MITNYNENIYLLFVFVFLGYGFVDFDSPAAAQKAVASLKANGVQAQMAKVRAPMLLQVYLICVMKFPTVHFAPGFLWFLDCLFHYLLLGSSASFILWCLYSHVRGSALIPSFPFPWERVIRSRVLERWRGWECLCADSTVKDLCFLCLGVVSVWFLSLAVVILKGFWWVSWKAD